MIDHDMDDSVARHDVHNIASRVSAKGLLLANAIPLVGILVFGWTPHLLLVSYWLETAVVLGVSVAKARRAEGEDDPAELPAETFNETSTESLIGQSKRDIISFFVYCYGWFWVMSAPFVFVFPVAVSGMDLASPTAICVAAISLVAQHAVSYWATYIGEQEYEQQGPVTVMFEPNQRTIVLHFTIILGGFILPLIGSGISLLIVRVLVKTHFDRWGQLKVNDPAWRRVTCPQCGETVEQTAAHCMYCSANLTAERGSATTDADKRGDQTETAPPDPQESPQNPQETASKTTEIDAEIGYTVTESIEDSPTTALRGDRGPVVPRWARGQYTHYLGWYRGRAHCRHGGNDRSGIHDRESMDSCRRWLVVRCGCVPHPSRNRPSCSRKNRLCRRSRLVFGAGDWTRSSP